MVIVTGKTVSKGNKFFISVVSEKTAVANTIELSDLDPSMPHCFLGIQMFDASDDPIVGGAGTFAITIKTTNTQQYEAPPTASIDATAPTTIDWAANTAGVKCIPSGITTAVTYRLVMTFNQS